jgi:hypothetical protein
VFFGYSRLRKRSTKLILLLFMVLARSNNTHEAMITKIRCMYNVAIRSAFTSEFMNGRALANKRAGIFALETGDASIGG